MILHYDTQKVKDLYANKFIRLDKRCFKSLDLEGSLYKITRHIFILAIQGIQGYSTENFLKNWIIGFFFNTQSARKWHLNR